MLAFFYPELIEFKQRSIKIDTAQTTFGWGGPKEEVAGLVTMAITEPEPAELLYEVKMAYQPKTSDTIDHNAAVEHIHQLFVSLIRYLNNIRQAPVPPIASGGGGSRSSKKRKSPKKTRKTRKYRKKYMR